MLRNRRGFTLTELMVAMVILSIVMASITGAFIEQQRFYSAASDIMNTRDNIREGADAILADLRPMSPADSDIYTMGTAFIEYRASTGASTVCSIDGTKRVLTLPPLTTATNAALSSWITTPAIGDSVLIFDPGANVGVADDSWGRYEVTVAPVTGGACPNSTGLTTTAAEAAAGLSISVSPALTGTTPVGAPMRFFRRTRYQLYFPSGGSGWYLGMFDCNRLRAQPCTELQPVSGPYLEPSQGGLAFAYYDSSGVVTADRTKVTRIDLVVRSRTAAVVRAHGFKSGLHGDSVAVSIALRNRPTS